MADKTSNPTTFKPLAFDNARNGNDIDGQGA